MTKYILNITFAEPAGAFGQTCRWLHDTWIPQNSGEGKPVANSHLMQVIGIPGDPDFNKEVTNITLQLVFCSQEAMNTWHEEAFSDLLDAYRARMRRDPLFFVVFLKQYD